MFVSVHSKGTAPSLNTLASGILICSTVSIRSVEEFHPLPVIYYPFVEYVHILVQLICAQFKSDMIKDNGYTGRMKMETNIKILRRISAVCMSLLC